jgi:predicted O-methyltransferase YrrM
VLIDKARRGLTTANLRSLRFSSDPIRFRDYLRDLEVVYQSYTYAPLQSVELAELVGIDFCEPLFLPAGCVRPGSTPLSDLAALAALARKKRPKRIFEIGTFEGLTTVVFVKNSGTDAFVNTLDLPHDRRELARTERSYTAHSITEPYVSGHLIDKFGVRQQSKALFGDSVLFDFGPYRDQIDLFFVDGAHTEDYVALDSSHAFECLAPDGWVLWHDCFTPQVMKVLRKVAQTAKLYQIRGTNLAFAAGKLH